LVFLIHTAKKVWRKCYCPERRWMDCTP